MTVEVYPSKLDGAPLEQHETHHRQTVETWLIDNVPNFGPREIAPISVELNGVTLDASDWSRAEFGPGDTVRIYPEPKGLEVSTIIAIAAGVIAVAATILLQPSIPKQRQQGNLQGSDLDEASLKGNKVKINSPIREVAGHRKIYPDYLLPLHRYFESPQAQVVETLLCVGKGRFDAPLGSVLIGDTPLVSLGADADFDFYDPGASLAGDPRAVWWHSAPEVGATSTGTAGLELRALTSIPPNAEASAYDFNGFTVTIPAGAGSFPTGWVAGLIVRIEVEYPYTVDDNTGTGGRDVINGDITQLALPDGALIEITGDNAGDYEVFDSTATTLELDYPGAVPAVALQTGSVSMCIGYRGLRYRITAATPMSLTLERLTDTGATDASWPGFSALTSFTATLMLDGSSLEGGWAGPFAACPGGPVTDTIEFDVMFPGGLFQVNKYGNPAPYSVTVEAEYRDIATAGAWTPVSNVYSTASVDQIGFTETIALGSSFRPEVRLRRVGADSASPQIADTVQWYGLRAKLQAPTSYAGVTTLALKVRGGSRLSAQSEQLVSVEATRILPVRAGGVDIGEAVTRDIAPWVRYVANTIGYPDSALDLAELDRLGDIWSARGDFYDNAVSTSGTAKAAINTALRAGFAEMTIDRGLLRPVRDEPREAFEHMYTPQNCTEPLVREFQAVTLDDPDGVDVQYTDGTTWQVETVECRLPGDIGLRVESIQLEGVIDRDRAWRIGMRQRRAQKYRRFVLTTATELDALNSRYLSYVAMADNVPGYGKSAVLTAISPMGAGHLLVSSEPFDWSGAGPWNVALRKPDGTLSGPYAATRVDDKRLTIAVPLDFVPDLSLTIEPPHLLFGTVTKWVYPALVTEISPRGSTGANISAVNYDVRVYEDDDGTAPA